MRVWRSVVGRIKGVTSDIKSGFWEYSRFYADGEIWENSILLESFGGVDFQGNPYYIYKEMLKDEQFSSFKIYISHRAPDTLKDCLIREGMWSPAVEVIKTHSAYYRDALSHCKYLVNNVSFTMDFIKKPGQMYLNTWHGTPLKCLGRNIKYDPFECNNAQRNFLLCDYLIAPNEATAKVFAEDYMVHDIMPGEIKKQGYPRNSVFFDLQQRKDVREKYQLENVISILFMPTWRGKSGEIDDVDQVGEIEQLARELGDKYRVYVKFHPAMTKNENFQYCHKVPEELEIYEFLNGVDILITDYSSVFFDFANTGKRIILYQYDKEAYFKSRGIYREIEKQINFQTACTYEELKSLVLNNEYIDMESFRKEFCPYDMLYASEQALLLLLNPMKKSDRKPVDLFVIDFPVTDEWLLSTAESLSGRNYRFVFIPKRSNGRFCNIQIFDEIDYMMLSLSNRLTIKEKLTHRKYALREMKRLWGEIKIGHVYAKSKNLPLAVKYIAEPWPQILQE